MCFCQTGKGTAQEFVTRVRAYEEKNPVKCSATIDMVFVMDASGSIGNADYQVAKKFVENVLMATRVALISFSSQVRVRIPFADGYTKSVLISKVCDYFFMVMFSLF